VWLSICPKEPWEDMRSESLNHLQTLDGSMQNIINFVGSLALPFWDMVTQFPGGLSDPWWFGFSWTFKRTDWFRGCRSVGWGCFLSTLVHLNLKRPGRACPCKSMQLKQMGKSLERKHMTVDLNRHLATTFTASGRRSLGSCVYKGFWIRAV
jgi:hypothetical protein